VKVGATSVPEPHLDERPCGPLCISRFSDDDSLALGSIKILVRADIGDLFPFAKLAIWDAFVPIPVVCIGSSILVLPRTRVKPSKVCSVKVSGCHLCYYGVWSIL
jgi:hypothetical protein